MALKVVVQRARGRERGGRMGEAGGRREKRDHSCKLDSNKAPLMSPLGDWEERERERYAHLQLGWMLTFKVAGIVSGCWCFSGQDVT